MSKRIIALLFGALVLGLVAGCGGSDDEGGEETLTKAEFIKQGDAICRQGNEEIEEGFDSFAKENGIAKNQEPNKEQSREIVVTVIIPGVKQQGEEIRALGAPAGDEDQVAAILDSLDEGIEEAEADPESLFEEKTDPFGEANQRAKAYGLKVCGQE